MKGSELEIKLTLFAELVPYVLIQTICKHGNGLFVSKSSK